MKHLGLYERDNGQVKSNLTIQVGLVAAPPRKLTVHRRRPGRPGPTCGACGKRSLTRHMERPPWPPMHRKSHSPGRGNPERRGQVTASRHDERRRASCGAAAAWQWCRAAARQPPARGSYTLAQRTANRTSARRSATGQRVQEPAWRQIRGGRCPISDVLGRPFSIPRVVVWVAQGRRTASRLL
jgi:hypothetical protein